MPTLSVVVLTRNERHNLSACLNSLGDLADEIIVLDGFSTDGTPELAASLGARVVLEPRWEGWGRRRQLAQQHCSCDYVMHLDADERLTPELVAELREALSHAGPATVLALPRLTELFGTPIRHCGWYPDYVYRVYPRCFTHYDDALVHEKLLLPAGTELIHLKNHLRHYSYPDIAGFLRKQSFYALCYGRDNKHHATHVSLALIPLRAMAAFGKSYFIKRGFLDGWAGLWLSLAQGAYVVYKYLALAALLKGCNPGTIPGEKPIADSSAKQITPAGSAPAPVTPPRE